MAFPTDWAHKVAITIDSADISADLSDWTLVLDQAFSSVLTQVNGPLDADGTAASLDGGGDVRFTSDYDGNNRLACDVRDWSTDNTPANATCEVAVKIASVSSSSDTTIYMWWGKSGETQPAVGDTYGQYDAYDDDHLIVWPFRDFNDRTDNENHASIAYAGSADAGQSGGPLGQHAEFSGTDIQRTTTINHGIGTNPFAIEMVVLRASDHGNSYEGIIGSAALPAVYFELGSGNEWGAWFGSSKNSDSVWPDTTNYHHAVFYRPSGSDLLFRLDGASDGSETTTSTFSNDAISIGSSGTSTSSGGNAFIAETRIHTTGRSVAWWDANHANQLNTSGFLTFGSIDIIETGTPDLFDNDFEDGDLSEFSGSVTTHGTIAASTSAKKNGTYGARATFDGVGGNLRAYETIADTGEVWVRGWFRFSSGFTIGGNWWQMRLMGVHESAGAPPHVAVAIQEYDGALKWRLQFNYSPFTADGNDYFTPDTNWKRIELYSKNNGGVGNDVVRAKVFDYDGTPLWDSGDFEHVSVNQAQTCIGFGGYDHNGDPANGDYIDIDDCAATTGGWIGDGASTPTDALTASDLVAGTPVLDAPTIGQTHALTAADLAAGAPALDAPSLGQAHALTASNLEAGTPTLGTPALADFANTDVLTASDLAAGAPVLDAPTIGQTHALEATDTIVGAPVLDAPSLGQAHVLEATDTITGPPVLGTPTLADVFGTDVLTAADLEAGVPVLGTPTIGQAHVLEATDTITGPPVLDIPTLGQVHALEAADLVAGTPVLGTPIASDGGMSEYFVCDSDIVTSLDLSSDILTSLDLSSEIALTQSLTSNVDLEEV